MGSILYDFFIGTILIVLEELLDQEAKIDFQASLLAAYRHATA